MCYNMSKLKILVPVDGTEKSMHSLDWLKNFIVKEDTEVTLINVIQVYFDSTQLDAAELENVKNHSAKVLEEAAARLEGYKINKLSAHGIIGDIIVKEAKDGKYDMIIMTKSSVKGISRIIGSVTNKVIHHSDVTVVVVPE